MQAFNSKPMLLQTQIRRRRSEYRTWDVDEGTMGLLHWW